MITSGVDKWQSFKRKDSLSVKYPTESVNGSLFQQKTVHLLFQAKITNGSLLREDGLFHLKIPQAVSKWQSLSAEDSLLTFSQQGLQMAVFFSRRQFDPRQKSANGSLFQQKTVWSFSSSRVYKWQSFPKKRQFVY